VKSVTLDKWTADQVKVMQEGGNAKAKELYEANVPEHHRRPNENDTYALEQWIRAKYERKEFMRRESKRQTAKEPTKEPTKTKASSTNGNTSTPKHQESKRQQQSANVADLLLLDDDSSASTQAQPKRGPTEVDQFQGFQSFQGSTVVPTTNDLFTAFQSAPTPAAQPAANNDAFWSGDSGNQAKPQASKESILQLFQTPLTVPSNNPMPGVFPSQPLQQRPAPNYNISLAGLGGNPGYTVPVAPVGFNTMGSFGTQVPSQFPAYGYGNQMMPQSTAFMAPTTGSYGGVAMPNAVGGFGNTPSPSYSMGGYVNPTFLAAQKATPTNAAPVILPTSASNFRL
jgi:hypothetical protein